MNKFLKSTGKKRGIGSWIVLLPMVIKYIIKLSNQQAGTDFEIDDDLLNILFVSGSTIWSVGVLHAYLPKVLVVTKWIHKALTIFNAWASKKVKNG